MTPNPNKMPDASTERSYSALDEQLTLRADRIQDDLTQLVSDLNGAKALAVTEAREALLKESVRDLAILAHQAVTAAKQFDVPDEWIQNGPPAEE